MERHVVEHDHAATDRVASAFVIVRAIDDDAFRFYTKYGFIPMPSDSRRLFLPLATIAKLLGSWETSHFMREGSPFHDSFY